MQSVITKTLDQLLQDPSLFHGQAYINGEWLDSASGEVIEVINPANAAKLGTVPSLGTGEIKQAIDVANAAYPGWRATIAKERARILRKWYELIKENQEDLAIIMTSEQGKSLAESRGKIAYAASFIEWFAEEAKRVYGDTILPHQANRRIVVMKEPIGVCAHMEFWCRMA